MEKFNAESNKIVEQAKVFGANSGGLVGTEHLICAMAYVDGTNVQNILQRVGFNKSDIQKLYSLTGKLFSHILAHALKMCLETAWIWLHKLA